MPTLTRTLTLTRQWVLLHGSSVPGDAQQQRHACGALASNPNPSPNPSPNPNPNPNQAGPWPVDSVMLFDLEADPTESNNVTAAH